MERVCPCAVFCWEITTPCKEGTGRGERDKEGTGSGERGRGEDEVAGARLSAALGGAVGCGAC